MKETDMQIFEVGVVRGNVVSLMWRAACRVWRTWRYARSIGANGNEWYGVYVQGTEVVLVDCGPLPGAQGRAELVAKALARAVDNAQTEG